MADFPTAYNRTNVFEGFYSNNMNDTGKETLYGISRVKGVKFPEFWAIVDSYKKKPGFPENMRTDKQLKQMTHDWYKKHYWDVLRADEISSQSLANKLYDISVNKGCGVAIRFMSELTRQPNIKMVTDHIIKYLNDEKRICNNIS